MRLFPPASAAVVLLLASCGGSETADREGLSEQEVIAVAGDLVQPRPGQYSTSVELLEFNAPGLPDSAREQVQGMMTGGMTQGASFCMTEEDAARNGPQQMVKNLANSDCTVQAFEVSGTTVKAQLQCAQQGGASGTVRMNGEMTEESSDMTMDMSQDMAGMGSFGMKMRVQSQRTGDCT